MPENEAPKRLQPSKETLRELLLLSGNRCAFPGCNAALLDIDGNFVAQLCHIEAALPGGERFNKQQSNEQRRGAENLLLMCYEHHVVTNDVDKYNVERMRKIKADHEAKFAQAADRILEAEYRDRRAERPVAALGSLKKYRKAVDLSAKDVVRFKIREDLANYRDRLADLPREERLLLILVARLLKKGDVTISELRKVTRIAENKIVESLRLLEKQKFLDTDYDYADPLISHRRLQGMRGGLDNKEHIESLLFVCDKMGLDEEQVIADLRFDLL